MEYVLQFLLTMLLGGVAFTVVARIVPEFHIHGGFGSAVVIALVYSLLKAILQGVLIFFSLPLVIVSFGLFIVAINVFLLWLTDKILDRFEVRTTGALVVGTVLLSIIDIGFRALLPAGALL